jgi:hypothetical protein
MKTILKSIELNLIWEQGHVVVIDVDDYVIIRKLLGCFEHASCIHMPKHNGPC